MKKFKIIVLFSLLLLLIAIPYGFALDNEDIIIEDAQNYTEQPPSDYYFDENSIDDGNGSAEAPFKEFSDDRIKENSTIHLSSGEYVFEKSRTFSNITFNGKSAKETILNGNGSILTINGVVNFKNITLTNFNIRNNGNLNASNVIFKELIPTVGKQNNVYGGAIYAPSNKNIYLDNCTIFNNSAEYGGAIYVNGGDLVILNSLFYNNIAYNYGGAIACESNVRLTINNSRFKNDSSINDAGGAIYLVSSNFKAYNLTISDCSSTFGAAITALKSNMGLNNLIFNGNVAKYEGGAIYQVYGSIILNESKFINNTARNGGGLFIDDVNVYNMDYNEFTNNMALNYAGAIYSLLKDSINLTSNIFENNSASLFDDVYNTSSVNLTICSGNYKMIILNQTFNSTLPSSYDLRDYGYVTPVKDQKDGGNCWAFSSIAALESCILKATGEVLDLSEENMKNLMAFYSDYGINYREPNLGGDNNMPIGYLVSWLGPVNENDDLYDDKSHLSPVLNSIIHVQNVLFIKRNNFTDNDAIKQAIMNYGAVSTTMFYSGKLIWDSSGKKVCLQYYNGDDSTNHAVAIVGWDDNLTVPYAPAPGAWIVKNSWGPSWPVEGQGGYFHVSYYDTSFARPGNYASYTFILNDTQHFDKNYQYDFSGPTDYFYNNCSTVWYENAFTATDNEFIAAVSTYFNKITDWEINIYVNSTLQLIQKGFSAPGYYTINLDYPVPVLKGDIFEVLFKITVDGDAGFPISEAISLTKYTYSPNVSFVSYDNGNTFFDLYDLQWYNYPGHSYVTQVACIKAFTQLITLNSTIKDLNITYDSLDLFNVTVNILDENNNSARNGFVVFTINGVNHTASVFDGVAFIQIPLTLGVNNISCMFNSPNYYSSRINATYEVLPIRLNVTIDILQDLNNAYINFTFSKLINENITVRVNDEIYPIKSIDGKAYLNLTDLDYGNYNITVTVDKEVYGCENSTNFFENVKRTYFKLNNLTTIYNSGEFLIIKLFDEFGESLSNSTIEFILNNVSYSDTTDGEGKIVIPINLTVGNYTLEVSFKGDELHLNSTNSSKITVNPSNTIVNILDIVYNSFDLFNISTNVQDQFNQSISNGTLIFTINNVDYEVDVTDGVNNIQKQLVVGKNNITVLFKGNNYISSNYNTSFNVSPVILGLNITILQDYNNVYISFVCSQAVNETIQISGIDQKNSFRLINGKGQLNLTNLDYGEYLIKATLDSDFYNSTNSTSFFVNVKRTYIEVNDLTTTYNSGELLKIRLFDQFKQPIIGKMIKFSIDNKNYVTDENGTVIIPIILKNSIYKGIISFEGDDLYFKSQNTSIITVKSSIKLPDIKYYVLNSQYIVNFIDKNKKPLKNTLITFTIANKNYKIKTDSSGKAVFKIPLYSGNYKLSVSNPNTGEILSQNVKILKRITQNKDISVYYGNYPIYKVRVCDDNAKFVKGIIVKVKVNGKTYSLKTDKNGFISLKIKLNNGKYVITSECKGFKVSNKITIKSTLITKNMKVKKGKIIKFKAKLLNKNGKIIKGKKVIFKVKGKTYKVKTNKKGIAVLKLKNLKAGKYKIVSSYGKVKFRNTITIKK